MDHIQQIYPHVQARLQRSTTLEKIAGDDALIAKAANDMAIMAMLKHAASPLMRGLAYGAGAAVPLGLAGSALIHQAGKESRKTVEDVRNKALQTALGIAGIGGGLYALHRTMGQPTKISALRTDPVVLLEKLATVGFLDVLFEDQCNSAKTEQLRQKAGECLLLNAEHGVDILQQLLD